MAMLVSANCGVYSFYSGQDPPLAKAAPKMWACYQNLRRPHFINWNPSLQIYTLLQILTDFMRLPCSWAKSQVSILENRTAFRPQLSFLFQRHWHVVSDKLLPNLYWLKNKAFFLLTVVNNSWMYLSFMFLFCPVQIPSGWLETLDNIFKHQSFCFSSIPLNFIL